MLSGFAFAVGSLGFLLAAHNIITVSFDSKTLEYLAGYSYPHARLLLYLMDSANLLFGVMLLAAVVLLWKLERRGLLLLICVLITEFIFVLCIIVDIAASKGFSKPLDFMVGRGLFPLAPQLVTAFPIVAGILIFFAYRYQRTSARAVE